MDGINIGDLALPKKNIPSQNAKARLPRHQPGEKFLKGPIPLNWISTAAQLPGKSFQVAMAIWFLAGLNKSATVKLNQKTLTDFGVDRHSKYRALDWLTEAQLIAVDKQTGKSPIVTILSVPVASL